ncbi:MAG: hypothetical protein ACON4W_02915 [Parvibaculales bacterium]
MKKVIITLTAMVLSSSIGASAAEKTAVAVCTPSSHKIVVGLDNTSASVSKIEFLNSNEIFTASSFTNVADSSGEPHTITLTSAEQTNMSSAGFTFSSNTTMNIIMDNDDVWSVTCD